MKKKTRNFIMAIVDVLVVLVVIYFIVGYIDFYNISRDEEPLYVVKENSYKTKDGNVKVYDNVIYKIVRHEVTGKNVSYGLKLWFMEDVE